MWQSRVESTPYTPSTAVADPGFWKRGFSSNSTQPKAVHRGA